MRRVPLGNYGFGNREELARERIERLKRFRWTAHIVSILTLIACFDRCASAQSLRPRESEESKRATQNQKETADQLKAIADEIRAVREQQAKTEAREAAYEAHERENLNWPPQWSNWVLAFFAAIAAFIAARTLSQIKRQVTANSDAALAAKASAHGLKNAERAYVGLRDREWSDPDKGQPGSFRQYKTPDRYKLDIRIVNTGRTPAHILGGMIRPVRNLPDQGFQPPHQPPNDKSAISGNFLHAGDRYRQTLIVTMDPDDVSAMKDRSIWLVGYVDYADAFKTKHRAGYCRRVSRKSGQTEITLFVDHSCVRYNYDRERQKGEGNDWEE